MLTIGTNERRPGILLESSKEAEEGPTKENEPRSYRKKEARS